MPNAAHLAVILAALSVATAPFAHAGSARPSQTRAGAPPKECPRLNSRYGYYGNPWCTEAEQRVWDIWEARARKWSSEK